MIGYLANVGFGNGLFRHAYSSAMGAFGIIRRLFVWITCFLQEITFPLPMVHLGWGFYERRGSVWGK